MIDIDDTSKELRMKQFNSLFILDVTMYKLGCWRKNKNAVLPACVTCCVSDTTASQSRPHTDSTTLKLTAVRVLYTSSMLG